MQNLPRPYDGTYCMKTHVFGLLLLILLDVLPDGSSDPAVPLEAAPPHNSVSQRAPAHPRAPQHHPAGHGPPLLRVVVQKAARKQRVVAAVVIQQDGAALF